MAITKEQKEKAMALVKLAFASGMVLGAALGSFATIYSEF